MTERFSLLHAWNISFLSKHNYNDPVLIASSLLSLFLLATPAAEARDTFEWNFLDANIPGRIEITGWTKAEPTQAGLHIQTERAGHMTRATNFPHPVESVAITLGPGSSSEAVLLWHVRGSPEGDLVQLPFVIQGSSSREVIRLGVSHYPQWDPLADRLGFALSADSDITIRSIEFSRWNILEKATEAFRSFWIFDVFRPYSINFLWGPLLTFNPVSRDHLFLSVPPMGWSANRFLYLVIVLAGMICWAWWMMRKNTIASGTVGLDRHALAGRAALKRFLAVLAALWIFYDLRMGLEFLNYYRRDYVEFVAANPHTRTFRERGGFNDFADLVAPLVRDRDRYIFLSIMRWPYLGAIRYLTYPSIPTDPAQQDTGVDTWVVYRRTDMDVNDAGMLLVEGEPVAGPGDVLLDFEPGSFVYRIRNPLPSPAAP